MLSAFSPDVATTGRAAFDVKVTGLADQPLVDGRMSIENGGLVVREPRLAITDLQGTVTFARDALQFGDITANANGGTLRMTGSIQYPKFAIAGGSIAISGRGLAVEVPEDLRSEIDADLRLDLSDKAPTLTGSLTVLRGSYREPVSLAAQLLTGVADATGCCRLGRRRRLLRPRPAQHRRQDGGRACRRQQLRPARHGRKSPDCRHGCRACSDRAPDDWRRRRRLPRRPHLRRRARHRRLHEHHARRADYRSRAADARRSVTTSPSK